MSSSNIVILQLVVDYGVDEEAAVNLGALKSIFVLIPSFGSSYVLKFGYKNSMLCGLLAITLASLMIATVRDFWAVPVLFAVGGFSHTLIKLSVYSTIGLIALYLDTCCFALNSLCSTERSGKLVCTIAGFHFFSSTFLLRPYLSNHLLHNA